AGVSDHLGKFGAEFEAVRSGKAGNALGFLAHAVNEAQALAFALYRVDDRFAPPSKTDNRGIDHERGTRLTKAAIINHPSGMVHGEQSCRWTQWRPNMDVRRCSVSPSAFSFAISMSWRA